MKKKTSKRLFFLLTVLLLIVAAAYLFWSQMINVMMPSDSRPGKIVFEE